MPKTRSQTKTAQWPGIPQQLAADLRWAAAQQHTEQGQPMETAYDWQTQRSMERATGLLEQWAAIADGGRHHRTVRTEPLGSAHLTRVANALADVDLNWSSVGRHPADQYRAMAERLHHLGLLTPPAQPGPTFDCGGPGCDATASTDTALAEWSHPASGPWLCPACTEKHWSPAARARLSGLRRRLGPGRLGCFPLGPIA